MLQAIKELGEFKLKREGRTITDIVSILVENPNAKEGYPKTLVVIFEERDGQLKYVGIQPEETKTEKYLYRFYAPNGPDYTPTVRISASLNKTFENKIVSWFKKNPPETPFLEEFNTTFLKSRDHILENLQTKWKDLKEPLDRNQDCVITFAIRRTGTLDYLDDIEDFKELLVNKVKARYQKISRQKHVCSICGKVADEVYGDAIPIPFYTLDKPGYIAGGFREQEAWRNAPTCLACSLKSTEGKKFLDDHLTFTMGGQQYYLIPELIIGGKGEEDLFDLLESTPPETLKALKKLSDNEKEILALLADLKDIVTFNLLFFETPTRSTFRINLLVEDILPSRLSHIFEAKRRADACDLLHKVKVEKDKYADIEFRFDNEFKRFTPSRKAFLEVVDRTFRGLPLDRDLVLSWIMNRVRQDFSGDGYLKPLVLKGLSALLFFNELGLFELLNQQVEGGEPMTELDSLAESFFDRYGNTFTCSAHKAVFLLGVLTESLLYWQRKDRELKSGKEPFRRQLKGLKMKEEDLKGLFPKVQNKLEEYGRNYYSSLESLIAQYFLQAGRDWDMSTDDMNLYFVLGMNLQDRVSQALGLKKQEKED